MQARIQKIVIGGAGYSNRRQILPTPSIFVLNRRKKRICAEGALGALSTIGVSDFHRAPPLDPRLNNAHEWNI